MSEKSALLVIDVQMAFFQKGSKVLAYNGEEHVARMREVITRARKAGVPVIYVQHDGAKGSPWEPGTPGHAIHPSIAPKPGELIVHKPTPDAFHKTNLQEELDKRGIKRLTVVGIQSDWCVDTTVRRAYSLEYETTVVEDAHTTFDTEVLKGPQIIAHHNSIFAGRFAKLVKTADVDFSKP
jgi:nicotinamidase-related amidase